MYYVVKSSMSGLVCGRDGWGFVGIVLGGTRHVLVGLLPVVRVRFIGLTGVWVVVGVVFDPLFGIYHLWAPLGVEACRVGGGSSEVGSTRRL